MTSNDAIGETMSRHIMSRQLMFSKYNRCNFNSSHHLYSPSLGPSPPRIPSEREWKARMNERKRQQEERAATRGYYVNMIPVDIKSTKTFGEAYRTVYDLEDDITEKIELDLKEFGEAYQRTWSTTGRSAAGVTELLMGGDADQRDQDEAAVEQPTPATDSADTATDSTDTDSADTAEISSKPSKEVWKQRKLERKMRQKERLRLRAQNMNTTLEDIDSLRKIGGTFRKPCGLKMITNIEKSIERRMTELEEMYKIR